MLEEEATSSQPIPDALLPRVIDFIREFSVFHQTVVHCARKTELALWPHLFAIVGNPKLLFQRCLKDGRLDTAASYIIILQNLEKTSVSRQHATLLLDHALNAGHWQLSKDLLRFLRAIDPTDVDTPPSKATIAAVAGASHPHSMKYIVTPSSLTNTETVIEAHQSGRKRSQSSSSTLALNTSTTPPAVNANTNTSTVSVVSNSPPLQASSLSDKAIPIRRSSTSRSPADDFFLDTILSRHGRQLLIDCRIKDLGLFAAHLDFHLVSFLKKERYRAARIEDFVYALKKIHTDFEWPLPFQVPSSFDLTHIQGGSGRKDSGIGSYSPSLQSTTTTHLDAVTESTSSLKLNSPIKEESNGLTDNQIDEDFVWSAGGSLRLLDNNLETMAQEIACKGSSSSDIQLRYLLQLMLEAGCLDWSFLIAMVLRDILAVSRVVNGSRRENVEKSTVEHLLNGIKEIEEWSSSECVPYKSFLVTIRNQVKALSTICSCKGKKSEKTNPNLIEGGDDANEDLKMNGNDPDDWIYSRLNSVSEIEVNVKVQPNSIQNYGNIVNQEASSPIQSVQGTNVRANEQYNEEGQCIVS